jgi:hypothetical protein
MVGALFSRLATGSSAFPPQQLNALYPKLNFNLTDYLGFTPIEPYREIKTLTRP